MNNQQILSTAIGSLLILGLAGNATAADKSMEKCYGVAKAGANDCGGKRLGMLARVRQPKIVILTTSLHYPKAPATSSLMAAKPKVALQ